MVRLSVVVPMFNAERFVDSCFEILDRQGLQRSEFEVVVVDDGSTDATGELCSRYVSEWGNVTLLRQENSGAGVARNRGMDAARGTYLYFFDVDDELDDGSLRVLLERCESSDLDVLFFGGRVVYEPAECERDYPQDPNYFARRQPEGVVDGEEMFIRQSEDGNFCAQPCLLMTKLATMRAGGIRFAEGIVNEDNLFVLQATLRSRRADVDPTLRYTYVVRPNTVTTDNRTGGKRFLAHMVLAQEFELERQQAIAQGKDRLAAAIGAIIIWFMGIIEENCPEPIEEFKPFCDPRFAHLAMAARFVQQDVRNLRSTRDEAERARRAEARVAELEASTTWRVGRAVTAVPRALKRMIAR